MTTVIPFEDFLAQSYRMREQAERDGKKPMMIWMGPDACAAMLEWTKHIPMVSLQATAQQMADDSRGELTGLPWRKIKANGIAVSFT